MRSKKISLTRLIMYPLLFTLLIPWQILVFVFIWKEELIAVICFKLWLPRQQGFIFFSCKKFLSTLAKINKLVFLCLPRRFLQHTFVTLVSTVTVCISFPWKFFSPTPTLEQKRMISTETPGVASVLITWSDVCGCLFPCVCSSRQRMQKDYNPHSCI